MTARELALSVVRDVFPVREALQRGAHESFDYRASRSGLDARDRAFAAELAYGSIRFRRYLDWLLAPYVGDRANSLPPAILEILRLGAYQLAKMAVEPHAAVSETVGLAKRHGHRGTAGLVNAVLRRLATRDDRTPRRDEFLREEDFLGTLYSFPTWIVTLARRVFDAPQVEPILSGMNAPAQPAVRVNLLRATVEDAIEALRALGASVTRSQLVPELLLVLESPQGMPLDDPQQRWDVQGEIAAVPVDLLAPRSDENGVELCSGRGNKTLQILGRTGAHGVLESIDSDRSRLAQQRARLEKLGAGNVIVHETDATSLAGAADMDFALVDAPCSGLGILGRQPEARWRKDSGDPGRLALLQASLLDAAATRVRPGGRLVYSVCSFAPEETLDRIEAFLGAHPDFGRGRPPERYAPWLLPAGDLRWPPGIEHRDGFFAALLERRGE